MNQNDQLNKSSTVDNEETTATVETEKPARGLKMRTRIKAGAHTTISGGDGDDVCED